MFCTQRKNEFVHVHKFAVYRYKNKDKWWTYEVCSSLSTHTNNPNDLRIDDV